MLIVTDRDLSGQALIGLLNLQRLLAMQVINCPLLMLVHGKTRILLVQQEVVVSQCVCLVSIVEVVFGIAASILVIPFARTFLLLLQLFLSDRLGKLELLLFL